MSRVSRLLAELKKPSNGITGVVDCSIGSLGDRSTWKVEYDGTQTQADIAAVAVIIANFEPDSKGALDAQSDRQSNSDRSLQALARAIHNRLETAGVNATTLPQFLADVRAEYRKLVI